MSMYAVIVFSDDKTPTINARAKTVQEAMQKMDDLIHVWVQNQKVKHVEVMEVIRNEQQSGKYVFMTVITRREEFEASFYVARDMCNE